MGHVQYDSVNNFVQKVVREVSNRDCVHYC